MIDTKSYLLEHIQEIQKKTKSDPQLIERSLHAFGLLEALVSVGMPLIFKGGTCLMILMGKPRRFSTDIDIIVEPNTNIQNYLEKASKIIPFNRYEEQTRTSKTGIMKKHYKFFYNSPLTNREFFILLDAVFEKSIYSEIISSPIKNDFILVDSEPTLVQTPSIDCILGDKLSAFAPHTCGIIANTGKSQEIIKQMYDCANLFDLMTSFNTVKETYKKTVEKELSYRDSNKSIKDVIEDTISACLSIISKGIFSKDDYSEYLMGVKAVASHIISEKYNPDIAMKQACKILFLITSIKINATDCRVEKHKGLIDNPNYSKLNFVKKIDNDAFDYLAAAITRL